MDVVVLQFSSFLFNERISFALYDPHREREGERERERERERELNRVKYGRSEKEHFFKKGASPGLFLVYFWSYQTNIITIFTTNVCEKISIQYTVPGFELWNMSLLP